MLVASKTGLCKNCESELESAYAAMQAQGNLYPRVVKLKTMFKEFWPKFFNKVRADEDAWKNYDRKDPYWPQKALDFKRSGEYIEACNLYFEKIPSNGAITSGWAKGIYKNLAAAGDFYDAIIFVYGWLSKLPKSEWPNDELCNYHYAILARLIQTQDINASREALVNYLGEISGNPEYSIDLERTDLSSIDLSQIAEDVRKMLG